MNHPGGERRLGSRIRGRRWSAGGSDQRGASLIEVLAAVALISVLFVAVAAGLTTSVKAGAATDQRQRLQAKVTSFTEGLRSLGASYVDCANVVDWESAYTDAESAAGSVLQPLGELEASVTAVKYWSGADYRADYRPDCLATGDLGSQVLTVRVEDGDRDLIAEVVVRDS